MPCPAPDRKLLLVLAKNKGKYYGLRDDLTDNFIKNHKEFIKTAPFNLLEREPLAFLVMLIVEAMVSYFTQHTHV